LALTRTRSGLVLADDFNRSDGAPGSPWVVETSAGIVSNRLRVPSSGSAGSRPGARAEVTDADSYELFSQSIFQWGHGDYPAVIGHLSNTTRKGYIGYCTNTGVLALGRMDGTVITSITTTSAGGASLNTDYDVQLYTAPNIQELWATRNTDVATLSSTNAVHVGDLKIGYLFRGNTTSSSNAAQFDDFIWCKSKYITVYNLPTGYKAKLLNASDVVVAEATESGGRARIDASRFGGCSELVPADGWTKVIVTDGLDVEVDASTGAVYPGDIFDGDFLRQVLGLGRYAFVDNDTRTVFGLGRYTFHGPNKRELYSLGLYLFAPAPSSPVITATGGYGQITVEQTSGGGGEIDTIELYGANAEVDLPSEGPGSGANLLSADWDGTPLVESGLAASLTRYYRAYALEGSNVVPSNVASATTFPGLSLIAIPLAFNKVWLEWNLLPEDVISHSVWRGSEFGFTADETTLITDALGPGTFTYQDTALVAGTTYWYIVAAVLTDDTIYSNYATVTTPLEGQSAAPKEGWVPVPRIYKRPPLGPPLT
jgi:hypothetical protein